MWERQSELNNEFKEALHAHDIELAVIKTKMLLIGGGVSAAVAVVVSLLKH